MSDDHDPAVGSQTLKPVTEALLDAIAFDEWPGAAAIADFGLVTPRHFEAVYHALKNDDVTPAQLDRAVGNGPVLTELMRGAEHNPHKGSGLVFTTPWDGLTPEDLAHLSTIRSRLTNISRHRAERLGREYEEERRSGRDIEPER